MIERNASKVISKLAQDYPVIGVTGPRQSGKTTLVRSVFPEKPYVSLENPDVLEFALEDPKGFLAQYETGVVFDEVQRAPKLFSYLQEIIDRSRKRGLFILTGSQQFGLMSGITQSLAGRVALMQLLPFSLDEGYPNLKKMKGKNLDEIIWQGLYPPIHDRKLNPHHWYGNYVRTYVERDVRQIINIRDLNRFQRFVRLCAGRAGQLLNLSNLASDCGINHNTAKAWISILEASYLIFLLPPHHQNFNKRLIKTPKIYFYDTGLVAWLLSIQSPQQLNNHPMRGSLFECLVVSEMIKSLFNQGNPSNLFFWRDRSGNEIDLLIDRGLTLQPIEIKSGQTVTSDSFKGLKKWQRLASAQGETPILIYGGSDAMERSGIKVLPWNQIQTVKLI